MNYFQFDFYGRENELKELNTLYARDGFKFVVTYGRRRVGKSTLIQKFINEDKKPNISIMALEQNDKQNLDSFSDVVLSKYPTARNYLTTFQTWGKALDYIIAETKNEKLVLFIDEYPYLANANLSISSLLQQYIDGAFATTNIMLILCGSSMRFMETQVLGHQSPLYGRRDIQLKVEAFDYYDCAKFFPSCSKEDKILAYSVTGGIPQYLNKLKAYDTIASGIINEFLKKCGSLYEEPRNLLMQELREPYVYNAIIRAIADGASKLNEISTKTGEETKKISKYLQTLISLRLVEKELPMFNTQERNGVYKICDNMFRFWYKFVLENNMNIESGMAEYVYNCKILPELPHYIGRIFEDVCVQFLKRKNAKMVLPIVFNSIGRWWGNNAKEKCQEEIDIIAVADKTAIFAECKWQNTVGSDVYENLKRKAALFTQFDKKFYYIFCKGEFSDGLVDMAQKDTQIKLVNLDNMFV